MLPLRYGFCYTPLPQNPSTLESPEARSPVQSTESHRRQFNGSLRSSGGCPSRGTRPRGKRRSGRARLSDTGVIHQYIWEINLDSRTSFHALKSLLIPSGECGAPSATETALHVEVREPHMIRQSVQRNATCLSLQGRHFQAAGLTGRALLALGWF